MNVESELRRIAIEKAALQGYAEATSKREPVDFATIYYAACDPKAEWPQAVQTWGDAAPAHKHVLDAIRFGANHQTGGSAPMLLAMIQELLKAVNG